METLNFDQITETSALKANNLLANIKEEENLLNLESQNIELNGVTKLNEFKLLDLKFALFMLVVPLCIVISSFLVVFIYQRIRENGGKTDFTDSHFSLNISALKCHKLAYPYYNTYMKRYQCRCLSRFTGNGVSHCDSCGMIRKNNVQRVVGGVEAKANSWPMAVYLEQEYKTRKNNSKEIVTKVKKLFQTESVF